MGIPVRLLSTSCVIFETSCTVSRTSAETKIGTSFFRASTRQSLGRASIRTSLRRPTHSPLSSFTFCSSVSVAQNVFSMMDDTTICLTSMSNPRKRFWINSWVNGRAGVSRFISRISAAAS